MPSQPPKATIFLVNLPTLNLLQQFSIGIDFNFFNFDDSSSFQFKGIKLIDSGLHFFHYNDLNLGLRHGFYMDLKDQFVYILQWNTDSEEFDVFVVDSECRLCHQRTETTRKRKLQDPAVQTEQVDEVSLNISKWLPEVYDSYQLLVNYETLKQQSTYLNKDWKTLTSKISMNLVNSIFPNHGSDYVGSSISSMDCSKKENEILLEQIYDKLTKKYIEENKDPTLIRQEEPIIKSLESEQYNQFNFISINLNNSVVKENPTLAEKTEQSMDKSLYLNQILLQNGTKRFIGEFQLCFVNIVILNNYNSAEQWLELVKLMSMSFKLITLKTLFYIEFFSQWNIMLNNLSKDLVQQDDSEGIVRLYDMPFLVLLKDFQNYLFYDIIPPNDLIKKLQLLILEIFEKLRTKFDMMISFDNHDEVNVFDNDIDEDDEFKPVIVSI